MYATGFAYFADGKIERLKLGNGLWESAKLNSRLQVTEIAMGYSVGDGSLMKLNYEYGELQTNGTVDATKNAGNIAKHTVNFSGLAHPFVQTYRYDSLDRIVEAKETVNGTQTWKQTFGFDRYGNRNAFYQIVGSQELPINNLTLPTVDQNTNRFSSGQGYGYDKNGNVVNDPASNGRNFIFDGDNKQIEVKNASGYTIGRYYYNGEGKRIKKVTDLETTIFVYDGLGKLVAEYSTATPPANPTINYTATDQLGSPRVLTNKLGQVVSRRDFLPFGEEIYANSTVNRTVANKYSMSGQDAVRQRFTGYQKDIETGLDFAEARYYDNRFGRFTAVDPLLASGQSADPQTFNRYVYVGNNPTNITDPTGMDWWENRAVSGFDIASIITGIKEWLQFKPMQKLGWATDFVDIETGNYVPIHDGKDQVMAATGKQIERMQDAFMNDRSAYNTMLAVMEQGPWNLNLTRAEFFKLARTVYAESSGGVDESIGIINVLRNRAQVDGTTLMAQVSCAKGYAVAGACGEAHQRREVEQGPAADQKRLNVNIAIARAIPGPDTTGGAFFWDGKDFNKNANPNGGWRQRHQMGYFFTDPAHDLYNQRNFKHRTLGYYYESTAVIGSTTFSRRYKYKGGNWR